jgi:sec-independent protein translocase protein TatA
MDCSSMNVMFGLFNLGGGEIILILALVLILFGAKKLPELAKGLGTGIKEFKKATREVTDEVSHAMDEPPPQPRRLPTPPTQTAELDQPAQTVPQNQGSPKV